MASFNHPARIVFLYSSLRDRSYSRLAAEEAAQIIQEFGAIVSLACYQKYLQVGKDFIPGYLELLSAGGSMGQVTAWKACSINCKQHSP